MTTFTRKPLTHALMAACAAACYNPANAALLSLSQIPLYVVSAQKADVLLIYSNSNAMDEDATGLAVGSASPSSKSEISRTAAKSLISNYTGQLNMGLMAYQQSGVAHNWLNPSTYDASFNPANYDPAWTGARNSTTHKKFKIPNATSPNASGACTISSGTKVDCVYYNVNLPYYSGTPAGNTFCYSKTPGTTSYAAFVGDYTAGYNCASTKTGTSDAAPGTSGAGYGSTSGPYTFGPTDSDYAQAIDDFGQRLTSYDVGSAWFSNSSPGLGYLHVPIANLDATQAGKLNLKLATSVLPTLSGSTWNDNPTSISGGNTATNPNAPLQNAGLSPITGTFKTAKDYFNGATGSFSSSQGGSQAAPPNSCGKDFVVFLTNGLPSVTSSGTPMGQNDYVPGQPYAAAEVSNAINAVSALKNGTRPVKSYVIGFALPTFTNNYFVTNPPNPLDQMAAAGGTTSAYYANDLTSLNTTFSTIFSDIIKQSGSAAAVALTSGSVVAGGKIYQGQFNSVDWSGDLIAYNTDPISGSVTGVAWDGGTQINSQNYSSGRAILTYKPSTSTGIPFRWPANPASPASTELDTTQTTALTSNPVLNAGNASDTGLNRLNFLRGQTGINGLRPRLLSVLGDIVNSAPAYVGAPAFNYRDDLEVISYSSFRTANASRTPLLYVGANDGMLHGFDAATGLEKLAYVPSRVYPSLALLTTTSYTHRYYVDGSPTVADTFYSNAWHTTLVSGLGAGGQGVFALDVTNPTSFGEANASSIVRWEYNDADLGYVGSQPSIVKLNTGEWAAVFSNGYNNSEADGTASTTGRAYLYIVNIASGALIAKLDTKAGTTATPNALASPTLVDIDGDGKVDYAYAGDLLGNVWKFDLCVANGSGQCANNASSWKVAFGTTAAPLPLFVAKDASNNLQPITGAIELTRHFSGDGYQLYFGTGKYVETADISNTASQTFYSLWDMASAPSVIASRSVLQAQTVTTTTTVTGNTYRTTSSNTVAWVGLVSGGTKRGWYMDLPTSGERVVGDPTLYNNRILFTTLIPDSAVCGSGGTGVLMELDAVTGSALNYPTFDVNGDGMVDSSDNLGTPGVYGSGVLQSSIPSSVKLQKNPDGPGGGTLLKPLSVSKSDPSAGVASSLKIPINALGSIQKRTSWRQLF
jgi:type IV pilus assembly protein PilY1